MRRACRSVLHITCFLPTACASSNGAHISGPYGEVRLRSGLPKPEKRAASTATSRANPARPENSRGGANEVEGVTLLTIHSARPRRERKGSSTATADIRRAVANPGVFSVFSICPDQVQQRDKVRGNGCRAPLKRLGEYWPAIAQRVMSAPPATSRGTGFNPSPFCCCARKGSRG